MPRPSFINGALKSKGLKLEYSPQNILNHEVTFVLGLVWVLISKFNIDDIGEEGKTAKEALLQWCKRKVNPYGVPVTNFGSSWKNGKALCCLIHKHRPDLMPNIQDVLDGTTTPLENLQTAISVAEEQLDIPALIDAEDVVEFADEKSMMTYLSYYWKAFAALASSENAARRIAKLVAYEKQNDELVASYATVADELLNWMVDKTTEFREAGVGSSGEETRRLWDELGAYRREVKPIKSEDKGKTERALASLNARLTSGGRPAYVPPATKSTEFINSSWQELSEAEREYDERLRAAMTDALERERIAAEIGQKADKYAEKAAALALFATAQTQTFQEDTTALAGEDLAALVAREGELEGYRKGKKTAMSKEKGNVEGIAASLSAKMAFEGKGTFVAPDGLAVSDLAMMWADLLAAEQAYEGVMNEQINSMRQQEKAVQAFGRKADKLAAWCDAADAYASRPVPDLKTLADAEAALKECEGKVDEAASKEGKLTKLSAHAAGLQGAAKDRAGARFNELEGKVAQSSSALQEKLAALKEAKEVQEAADSLRLECAQKAEEINAWADATAKELLVTKTTAESTSDVERALEKIGEHAAGIEERRVDLDALKQALAAAGVPSGECNPYSRFDNDELAASLDEVEELCQSRRDAINEEAKRQAGLDDMRKAFADNASSLMKFLHENGSAYNSALNDKLEDYAEQALATPGSVPGKTGTVGRASTVNWTMADDLTNGGESGVTNPSVGRNYSVSFGYSKLLSQVEEKMANGADDAEVDEAPETPGQATPGGGGRGSARRMEVAVAKTELPALEDALELVRGIDKTVNDEGFVLLQAAKAANAKLNEAGSTNNEFTDLGMNDLLAEWDEVISGLANGETICARSARALRGIHDEQDRYESCARPLVEWLDERTAHFAEAPPVTDLPSVMAAESTLRSYRRGVKQAMANERHALERTAGAIDRLRDVENRARYEPPEELTLDSIKNKWTALEEAEAAHDKALGAAANDVRRQAKKLGDFDRTASKLERWCSDVDEYVAEQKERKGFSSVVQRALDKEKEANKSTGAVDEDLGTVGGCEAALKRHAEREDTQERKMVKARALEDAAQKVEGAPREACVERAQAVQQKMKGAEDALAERRKRLEDALAMATEMDDKRLELAKDIEDFHASLTEQERALNGSPDYVSLDDVLKAQEMLATQMMTVSNSEDALAKLKERSAEAGIDEAHPNTYARFDPDELGEKLEGLQALIKPRSAALDEARDREERFDELRKVYADKEKDLSKFLAEQRRAVASAMPSDGANGLEDLESQLETLTELQDAYDEQAKPLLDAVKGASDELTAAGVRENPYANKTQHELLAEYDNLDSALSDSSQALGEALNLLRSIKATEDLYEGKAKPLLEWIGEQKAAFADSNFENIEGPHEVMAKQAELRTYRDVVKPAKGDQRGETEAVALSLETKLKLEGGREWQPPEGMSTDDIDDAWAELLAEEREYSEALDEAMAGMALRESLRKQAGKKLDNVERWLDAAEAAVNGGMAPNGAAPPPTKRMDTIADARAALVDHTNLVDGMGDQLAKLDAVDGPLVQLDAAGGARGPIDEREAALRERCVALEKVLKGRGDDLDQGLKAAQATDAQMLDLATKAEEIATSTEALVDDLRQPVSANSVADVERMQAELQDVPARIEGLKKEVKELEAQWPQGRDNPYSRFQPADLYARLDDKAPAEEREKALGTELEKQRELDGLRDDYAQNASQADGWCVLMKDKVAGVGEGLQAEDQLKELSALSGDMAAGGDKLQAAEDASAALVERGVLDAASGDAKTLNELRSDFDNLRSMLDERTNVIKDNIARANEGQVSDALVDEMRDAFGHFNKEDKGLDESQFKAVMMQMDMDVPDERIKEVLGKCEGGRIDRDSFVDFMVEQMRDTDTYDQIIESFKVLAADSPSLSDGNLQGLAVQYADFFTPDTVNYLESRMPEAEGGASSFDYTTFSKRVFGVDGHSNVKEADEVLAADAAMAEKLRAAEEAKRKAAEQKEEAARHAKEEAEAKERARIEAEEAARRAEEEALVKAKAEAEEAARRKAEAEATAAAAEQKRQEEEAEKKRLKAEADAKKRAEEQKRAEAERKAKAMEAADRKKAAEQIARKEKEEMDAKRRQKAQAQRAKLIADLRERGKQGMLEKKGSGGGLLGRTNWQERIFTLNAGGVLAYFKDAAAARSGKPAGTFVISPGTRVREESSHGKRELCFALENPQEQLIMSAATPEDKKSWMSAFAAHTGQLQ